VSEGEGVISGFLRKEVACGFEESLDLSVLLA